MAVELRKIHSAYLLGLAVFFIGLGQLLLLPPFEGFDEDAHYSSIQLIADEGRIPQKQIDRVSIDTQEYFAQAPRPYATRRPFHENGGLTYQDIFQHPVLHEAARQAVNEPPQVSRRFVPGTDLNWQAQHAPLAYIALVPFYQLSKETSWKSHLAVLRVVCWIAAFAGLVMAALATHRYGAEPLRSWGAGAILAWPLLSPMFFAEMARLGNDSFCVLFAGLAWAALMRLDAKTDRGAKLFSACALGVALGLGALTKAFFLPVAFGLGLLLGLRGLMQLWPQRKVVTVAHLSAAFAAPAIMSLCFLAIAGWWYWGNLSTTGTLSGAHDFVTLEKRGSFQESFAAHFSLLHFLKNIASIYLSFLWSGTWSMATLPIQWRSLLGLAYLPVIFGYLICLWRNKTASAIEVAPIFMIAPLLAGLVYHVFIQVSLGPAGVGTPGYYIHDFAPALGVATALGAITLFRYRLGQYLIAAWLCASMLFVGIAQWHQLNMFAGCAIKYGDSQFFRRLDCFDAPWALTDRLSVLVFPVTGLVCWAIGVLLVLAAVFFWRKEAISAIRDVLTTGKAS